MMKQRIRMAVFGLLALLLIAAPAAAKEGSGLTKGTVDLKSAGALTFGPHGILFIGDSQAATIHAIGTTDAKSETIADIKVAKLDTKIAEALGTTTKEIAINDIAVHPLSGAVYLSVSRGRGPGATPVVLRLDGEGAIKEVKLKDVNCAKTTLSNAAEGNKRQEAITGMRYLSGKLYVAGLSNEEFASTLRAIPFPFGEGGTSAGIEIFHGAHGKYETAAPVRTFVPVEIEGQAQLLAAYTCTPLVKIPVSDLKAGAKVKGTTVAELGNRNRPLDIITYKKEGKDYLLLANSARGVMHIPLQGITTVDAITAPVKGTAGLTYKTLEELKGVEQLDKLDATRAVILVRDKEGLNLQTIPLP